MVPHHEGAIEMARIEIDKGDNADLKKLAESIISSQERELKEMRAHLKAEGGAIDEMSDEHHSG